MFGWGRAYNRNTLIAVAMLQSAAAAEIVAIGASNTSGRVIGKFTGGVDKDQAFWAQLERRLHGRN
jgi:hypothetical protein